MTGPRLRLVLGSGSPRRAELVGRLGLEVETAAPNVDESPLPAEAPALHVLRIARLKARAVAGSFPAHAVLAADTVVTLGDAVYGKPADRADAVRMLTELAGKSHTVLTAVVLTFGGREASHVEAATVTMVPLRRDLVEWYVATGECDDKAGAYAVQGKGALLVERVEGNVDAVMGLPLSAIPALCADVGLALVREGQRLALSRRDGSPLPAPTA